MSSLVCNETNCLSLRILQKFLTLYCLLNQCILLHVALKFFNIVFIKYSCHEHQRYKMTDPNQLSTLSIWLCTYFSVMPLEKPYEL